MQLTPLWHAAVGAGMLTLTMTAGVERSHLTRERRACRTR
jgi:hypothetical protein